MLTTSKYVSYCGCGCGRIIPVGMMVIWENGKKPIRKECALTTTESIVEQYKAENPASKIEFIKMIGESFSLLITRKDGKKINAVYSKNGERVYNAEIQSC